MNQLIRYLIGLSLAMTPLLVGCGQPQHAVSGTAVTPPASIDSAIVDKVAAARCDHEQACNNVGGGKKYVSRDVCMDQLRGSLANDLNGYACPRGIDQAQLDQCMSAIRSEDCSHLLDTLSRIEKCRTGALCMK